MTKDEKCIGVPRDAAYAELKQRLTASTGLEFRAVRDGELAELIARRLADLRLRDCSSYADFLAGSAGAEAEMEVLIERLTVGETYFFRDPEQFAAIRDIILPDILERKGSSGRLRIWSAGCATGAEPYSLAILLMNQMAGRFAGWQIAIEATDLNRGYLTQAAAGKFRAWALRATSDDVKRECFSHEGRSWTIHPRYKQWISFRHLNLAASEFSTPWPPGTPFDLILCRNVMIYFAAEASRRLIGRFHQSLGDGGWLVVGAAEYGMEIYEAFRAENVAGARIYQKTAPAEAMPAEAMPAAVTKATPAEPIGMPAPGLPKAQGALAVADVVTAGLEALRSLADRGEWQAAADCGRELLTRDKLNPVIYFYQGLIFENLGTVGDAARWLRQAIYLDRGFAMAHYHLGLLLEKDGQGHPAALSFGNVLKVLACAADDAIIAAGGGVTVTELRELAGMHLGSVGGS